MKTTSILAFILFLLFSFSAQSQVVVANNSTFLSKFDLKKNKRPVSTKMKKGQTRELTFAIFKNNAYTFDFDSPKQMKQLNFIIENEDGEIIFDNAIASYCNSVIIYAQKTQKIKVILTTQPPKFFQLNKKSYKINIKVAYEQNIASL